MALFDRASGGGEGRRLLDLACGPGRHLPFLREAGWRPVGLDLSATLLREAARRAGAVPLVRADMRRLPFADETFDALVNFFTSFGYFTTREEDERAVAEMARTLRPGGPFMVDYLNAPQVRASLVPEDEDTVRGRRVRQRRWLEGGTVVKRIEIHPPGSADGEAPEVHFERVRLYDPEELEALLRRHGLEPDRRFGAYDGAGHGPSSPRLILTGTRA